VEETEVTTKLWLENLHVNQNSCTVFTIYCIISYYWSNVHIHTTFTLSTGQNSFM